MSRPRSASHGKHRLTSTPSGAALEQRAEQWKANLRAEPTVARLLLRRLVGPLTLGDEADGGLRWDAELLHQVQGILFAGIEPMTGFITKETRPPD